jgi:hypothetical protein
MKRANPERLAKRRAEQFGDAGEEIRWMPCCVPSCIGPLPSDPHHAKSRGAGGTSRDLVPLCHPHHVEIHAIGRRTFESRHRVDLAAEAQRIAGMLELRRDARRTEDE